MYNRPVFLLTPGSHSVEREALPNDVTFEDHYSIWLWTVHTFTHVCRQIRALGHKPEGLVCICNAYAVFWHVSCFMPHLNNFRIREYTPSPDDVKFGKISRGLGKSPAVSPRGKFRIHEYPPLPLTTSHSGIPWCNKYEGICEEYEGICGKYEFFFGFYFKHQIIQVKCKTANGRSSVITRDLS